MRVITTLKVMAARIRSIIPLKVTRYQFPIQQPLVQRSERIRSLRSKHLSVQPLMMLFQAMRVKTGMVLLEPGVENLAVTRLALPVRQAEFSVTPK